VSWMESWTVSQVSVVPRGAGMLVSTAEEHEFVDFTVRVLATEPRFFSVRSMAVDSPGCLELEALDAPVEASNSESQSVRLLVFESLMVVGVASLLPPEDTQMVPEVFTLERTTEPVAKTLAAFVVEPVKEANVPAPMVVLIAPSTIRLSSSFFSIEPGRPFPSVPPDTTVCNLDAAGERGRAGRFFA
jgi:hypothetical protein